MGGTGALWVGSWKQDWIQTVTKRTGYSLICYYNYDYNSMAISYHLLSTIIFNIY